MARPSYVHRADDGRGNRVVLLNGYEVPRVWYANTLRGVVVVFKGPLRPDVDHPGRVAMRVLYGTVEVRPARQAS